MASREIEIDKLCREHGATEKFRRGVLCSGTSIEEVRVIVDQIAAPREAMRVGAVTQIHFFQRSHT